MSVVKERVKGKERESEEGGEWRRVARTLVYGVNRQERREDEK